MKNIFFILLLAATSQAAVIVQSSFESSGNAESWTGTGSMSAQQTGSQAAPATPLGSLQGSFNSSFLTQFGSFRMNANSDFLGAYPGAENLTGFTFDFMAAQALPIDLNLRLSTDLGLYFITLDTSSLTLNNWSHYTVSLDYASGWQGDAAQYASALGNVTAVELRIATSGNNTRYFYMDNFATTANPIDNGGAAVPEPSTGFMVLYAGIMLYGMRRRVKGNAPRIRSV